MNNDNLVNLRDRTPEERKEIAKKGGHISAENRRNRKQLKEALIVVMNLPVKDNDKLDELNDIGNLHKKNVTVIEKIAINICKRAMDGDEKALNLILELTGERGNFKKEEIF